MKVKFWYEINFFYQFKVAKEKMMVYLWITSSHDVANRSQCWNNDRILFVVQQLHQTWNAPSIDNRLNSIAIFIRYITYCPSSISWTNTIALKLLISSSENCSSQLKNIQCQSNLLKICTSLWRRNWESAGNISLTLSIGGAGFLFRHKFDINQTILRKKEIYSKHDKWKFKKM